MRSHTLVLLLCLSTSSFTSRAETPPTETVETRLKNAASEMTDGWKSLREAFKKPDATNAERSQAVDALFTTLGNIVTRDGDDIVAGLLDKARGAQREEQQRQAGLSAAETAEKIKDWVNGKSNDWLGKLDANPKTPKEAREGLASLAGTLNELVDNLTNTYGAEFDKRREAKLAGEGDDEEAFTKAEEFVGKVRDHRLLPRAELAVRLLRDILRLEEQRVFDILAKNTNATSKIDAVASLSKDAMFIGKQARALTRMVIQIADTVEDIAKGQSELGEGNLLRAESRQQIGQSLEKFYPTLIQTADDLGIYYAKVVQSFSGLIYHVNREAYEKIDYFQGKLPQTMSFQQVKSVVEEDLGRPLEHAFATFEREPRANGSIAQVHFATTHATAKTPSQTVAVKVLKTSAPAELAWNQRTNDVLFKYAEAIAPKEAQSLVRFFTEQARQLGREFMGEMDLGAELWRQELFRKILKPIDSISIPATFPELSGPRVLTSAAVLDAKRIHEPFSADTWVKTPEEQAKADAEAAAGKEGPIQIIVKKSKKTAADATEAAADAEEALDAAKKELQITLNEEQSKDEVSLGELFMEFNEKFGYSVKPRYFQVLRSAIPFVSVNVHLGRTMKRLTDQGRDKEDPEVKALASMISGSVSSFLAQLFYAKELHADYNWGNLLVDPKYKTHLIDWGSTVQTQGLITQPLLLVGAVFKGDAKLVLKRLDQIGVFENLERDRATILARIQQYFDQEGLEKHSYPGVAWSMWKARRDSKAERLQKMTEEIEARVEARKKKKESVAEEAPTEAVEPAVAEPVVTETPAVEEAKAEDTPAPADATTATAEKKKPKGTELLAAGAKISWLLAKTLVKYPYERTRVRIIRANHGAPPPCSKYLTDI